jgi:hypothetical protein
MAIMETGEKLLISTQEGLNELGATIGDNMGTIGVGIGSALVGAGVGALTVGAISKKRKKRSKSKSKSRKKKTSASRSRGRKLKFGSKAYRKKYLGKHRRHKQRKPYTAGKRKDTSHRRIRFTKNNQPYVILPSGKARFISKSSARRSRKLKGGRY